MAEGRAGPEREGGALGKQFGSGGGEAPNSRRVDCRGRRLGQAAEPQFSSVAQSSLTLCDPMDCSTPGLPVHHQLPELAQTHGH